MSNYSYSVFEPTSVARWWPRSIGAWYGFRHCPLRYGTGNQGRPLDRRRYEPVLRCASCRQFGCLNMGLHVGLQAKADMISACSMILGLSLAAPNMLTIDRSATQTENIFKPIEIGDLWRKAGSQRLLTGCTTSRMGFERLLRSYSAGPSSTVGLSKQIVCVLRVSSLLPI